ncbi:MAG: integrase family protein [Gallionellaceae bacterium]
MPVHTKRLTKTEVESLPIPAEGEELTWCPDLPDFGVRVTASGTRSYIAQGRIKGEGVSRRKTIGQHGKVTADKARKEAMALIAGFAKGVDPVAEKKRTEALATTLREVATDYIANRRTPKGGSLTASHIVNIEWHIKSNFADWADKPIANINSDMCSARFQEISRRSESQANQAFRVLRALINYSMDEENPRPNPVRTLSRKKLWNPNKTKSGYIPLEKIGAVWNMLQERRISPALLPSSQTGADIIIFIMLTGCRWSEAAELTWQNVDLGKGTWYIADPKNHNPVLFPLSAPARALLAARPRSKGNDYIFPARINGGHIKDARPTMEEVIKLAGLHLTPHDLRRTFIAIGHELKIELWRLKLLTNHIAKGDVTIDSYTDTNKLEYLSGEIEQIAAYIIKQGAIAAGQNVVQLRGVA